MNPHSRLYLRKSLFCILCLSWLSYSAPIHALNIEEALNRIQDIAPTAGIILAEGDKILLSQSKRHAFIPHPVSRSP